ncbi:MAG: hypothetical protein K8R52_08510 [Bacteroidales bacterium]|nr:hypothetical protein [Bacteroidales bacterium]
MRKYLHITELFLLLFLLPSCFKEIDTVPIPRTIEETFTVQNSIRELQSYFRFYENTVLEVSTSEPYSWDLAFESAGEGSRVLAGWATYSEVVGSGKYDFSEITIELILDFKENSNEWIFTDPAYVNTIDSVALRNWEDGEIYIQQRGLDFFVFQFVSKTLDSYTFKYASAQSLDQVYEATIYRSSGFNYVYYSFDQQSALQVEPDSRKWDIVSSPYRGWWETGESGVYAPFNLSGILINNENGVRIAQVFDAEVTFEELDLSSIHEYEFIDMKGAIGSNWKLLGDQNSGNIYTMDPDKKYLMEKYDFESGRLMYFKLQIVDYKLNGADHHPTIEFKFLGEG